MPLPAIVGAVARGAVTAAKAAAQAAVAAAKGGVSLAAGAGRAVAGTAMSAGSRAAGAAIKLAPHATGIPQLAGKSLGASAREVMSGGMPALLRTALNAARSSAVSSAQSATAAAQNVSRAGQQAAQSLGQQASAAARDMKEILRAAFARSAGAGGGPGGSNGPSVSNGGSISRQGFSGGGGGGGGDGGVAQTLKDFTDPIGAATRKLIELPKKIKDFGETLSEGRRSLLDYNGGISIAVAKLDADRVRRNIALANATSGSAKYQSEAHSRLEQALSPGFERMTNILNKLTGYVENGMAAVVEHVNYIAEGFKEALIYWKIMSRKAEEEKKKPDEMPLNALLRNLAAGKTFERNNPPIHKKPKGWDGPK